MGAEQMSQDIRLAHRCPHYTVEEVTPLDTDRRTLITTQPILAAQTVRLSAGHVSIPQSGLTLPAVLPTPHSAPFVFESPGVITLTTPSVSLGWEIPAGVYESADALVRVFASPYVQVGERGNLEFVDINNSGLSSHVKVGGLGASVLGFGDAACCEGTTSGISGVEVYPPWRLVSLPARPGLRAIQFDRTVRNRSVLRTSYATGVRYCLRCKATYVENDYRFDEYGQTLLITQEDLLVQACLKVLLTVKGSNPFHPWYGTSIKSQIGRKALASINATISEEVRTALSRLQALQKDQGNYQPVSSRERLYSVLAANVRTAENDPTTLFVDVTVQNASSEAVQLNIVYTVPGVVALKGTNGLSMGTEIAGLTDDFRLR